MPVSKLEFNYEMFVSTPAEEVFAYLSNVDHYVEAMSSLEAVHGHSGPLAEGNTWQSLSRFMGREIIAENRVLELKAPHLFRYETLSNAGNSISVWELRPVDGGTRVRHAVDAEVKGFFAGLTVGLLKGAVNRQFLADMKRIEGRFNRAP